MEAMGDSYDRAVLSENRWLCLRSIDEVAERIAAENDYWNHTRISLLYLLFVNGFFNPLCFFFLLYKLEIKNLTEI